MLRLTCDTTFVLPTADVLLSQTLLGQPVDEIDTLDEVVSDLTLKVNAADQLKTVTSQHSTTIPVLGVLPCCCFPEGSALAPTLSLSCSPPTASSPQDTHGQRERYSAWLS